MLESTTSSESVSESVSEPVSESGPEPAELPPAAVMVAVGTDHHPFDRLVRWVDSWAGDHPGTSVLIQRGTSCFSVNCDSVELLPHADLLERFARSVAVVSHGGPSTVMDARMVGRLPIVVGRNPEFGEHVDDHQMRFAEHMRRHDLARVIDTEDELRAALSEALSDPAAFTVPVDGATIGGVVEFGRVLDRLLGVTTPLLPASPAEVAGDLSTPAETGASASAGKDTANKDSAGKGTASKNSMERSLS